MTREQAVMEGRMRGEAEADSRGETGDLKNERVARAMAYAAWEFDGKPSSSADHRAEFGGAESSVTRSLDRAVFGRLLKRGKDVA